jgi:SSS family solute:Na+ symporter
LIGAAVFVINKIFPDTLLGKIPFMMMAFYLCCVCIILQVVFSYVYPVVHTEESKLLYWKSPLEPLRGKAWPGIGNYKFLSAMLIAIMAVLYWIFR